MTVKSVFSLAFTQPRFITLVNGLVSAVKKTGLYLERDENERTAFLLAIKTLPPEKLIWMDEAGIDEILYRPYAYESKGKRAYANVTGKRVSRTTIIAGYRQKKLIAPWYFKGNTDRDVVDSWCENALKEDIKPGDVVVMDNATFHRYSKAQELIESYGGSVLWLPKYSPDLNKIEPQWANLKQGIRSSTEQNQNFFQTLEAQIIKMCA
jgi:transposase